MRISTGRIVSGRVELDGDPPAEGAVATVLIREGDESFVLAPAQERELLAAIQEADQGLLADATALLRDLR